MKPKLINDILVLGHWSDSQTLATALGSLSLAWTTIADCEGLVSRVASNAPAAVAILPAETPPAERGQWLATVRAGDGLWSSTPLVEWPDPGPADGLQAVLEQWMGPLADPAFRDPASPAYRLVRLVGLERAGSLLRNLASTLQEVLAQSAAGQVDIATAHRLAGLSGLYGFSELGRSWQAYETGDSPDAGPALAATARALDALDRWSDAGNRSKGLVP
ncbi:MAG TPA: hypothetical protein VI199_12205 [Novosphingobium sp.]